MIIGTSPRLIIRASGECGSSGESALKSVERECEHESESVLHHRVIHAIKVRFRNHQYCVNFVSLDSLTEDGICNKEPCPDEQQTATITTTASPSTECVDNESCDGMGDFHCSDSHVKSFCPRLCKSCPAQWSQWADWTECSATCAGMGMVTRQRTCVTSEYTTGKVLHLVFLYADLI